jgi:DNA-binding transcriptional LysR family regulator
MKRDEESCAVGGTSAHKSGDPRRRYNAADGLMDIDGLDITQLRLLEALAQTFHLSDAAARVGISPSAASHALARLRHDLRDPLFVRTSRGMRPTPYGERLSDSVVHALAALRSGLETPDSFDPRTSRRTFTILFTDLGQVYFLPKLVKRLAVDAPGMTLRARSIPVDDPHVLLESGEADLAVGALASLTTGFLQRRLFRGSRYVCMVRRGHPAFRKGMSLKALSSVPHALVDVSGMGHDGLRSALKRLNIPADIRLYFSQFMVLPSLLETSDMVVIAPASLADAVSKLVRVQVMDLPFKLPAFEIRLYWHERYRSDRANRWLRDMFVDLFAS